MPLTDHDHSLLFKPPNSLDLWDSMGFILVITKKGDDKCLWPTIAVCLRTPAIVEGFIIFMAKKGDD